VRPKNYPLKKLGRFFKRVFIIILFLLLWEISAKFGLLNAQILSSPSEIAINLFQSLFAGNLLIDVVESVKRVLVGFSFGSLIGILFALILGLNRRSQEYFGFIIEILRPIPPIAWIPIAILWFGVGDAPAYFLVGLGAFFPAFTNTIKAIKKIELNYVYQALSLGATKFIIFKKILIPLVLPDLMTGLRVGLGVGWIIVITAEMVGAQSGLGYMIQLNRIMLQTPNVIAGMVVIGIIGLSLSLLINFIENLIIPWQRRITNIEKGNR